MNIIDCNHPVKNHTARFTSPPVFVPAGELKQTETYGEWKGSATKIDAPMLGNGDMLAAFAGPPQWPQFWVTTNDFWQMESARWEYYHDYRLAKYSGPNSSGGPRPVGRLVFDIPSMEGAEYLVEQDFAAAVTVANFHAKDAKELKIKSWIAAGENILVCEFTSNTSVELSVDFLFPDEAGKGCDITVDLTGSAEREDSIQNKAIGLISGSPLEVKKTRDGLISGYRCFEDKVDIPTKVAFAGKFCGGDQTSITLLPGETFYYVLALRSWAKISRPLEMARSRAGWMTPNEIEQLRDFHYIWWRDFWAVSSVALDDPIMEQRYYLSQYVMASVSRDIDYPPNIFGIATFDRPAWNGDYKINYNHQSPFLALMTSGHFEQSDPHDAPYLAMTDIAKEMSRRMLHHEGIYLPLGLGPVGLTAESLLLHMKSPAVHGTTNMIIRYCLTEDRDYLKKVYPYLRGVAQFWENDMVFENGNYRVIDDGMHERTQKEIDKMGVPENPTNTLGYLKMLFNFMQKASNILCIDQDRIGKWKHIAGHLSPYNIGSLGDVKDFWGRGMLEGLTIADMFSEDILKLNVFYNEEKTGQWSVVFPGNIMQIYPAGEIGLNSDSALLETARNTIYARSLQESYLENLQRKFSLSHDSGSVPIVAKGGAWNDENLSCLFFPAAVRVGYNPDIIWQELSKRIVDKGIPNGFYHNNPHGIENLSTVPNTIHEMMLLSHEYILRFFKVWPRVAHPNAKFTNLWAHGAFQVSAELKDGVVCDISIVSNKGNPCAIENPWPGQQARITHSFGANETASGDIINVKTYQGQSFRIEPVSDLIARDT